MNGPLSTRQWAGLGLAVLGLLLAVGIGLWSNAKAPWQTYQLAYAQATGQEIQPALQSITPTLTGEPELCATCHIGLEEISAAHPVDVFGCVICHGGDRLALDKDRAHSTLRGGANPSDFSVVEASCGQTDCHGGYADPEQNHIDRVSNALMSTYAGGIALVRYSFGAQPDLTGIYGAIAAFDPHTQPGFVERLEKLPGVDAPTSDTNPVDMRFSQSCLDGGCHLSEPAKLEPYRTRSTSCAACHVLTADDGLYTGDDPTIPKDEVGHPIAHQLTTAIPYTQCNHCHNRGNYSLRDMSFTPRPDLPPAGPPLSEFLPEQTRRLIEYYQPIGQFTLCEWELDCVDCHTSEEVMGTGHIADAIPDSTATECRTCHGTLTEPPQTVQISDDNDSALRQARLNGQGDLEVGDLVVVNRLGQKLWSVKNVGPGIFQETLKVSGKTLTIPQVLGSACQQQPDEQTSQYCHACHAYPRDEVLNGVHP